KTRVSSTSQVMVRFDEGTVNTIDATTETAFITQIENAHEQCNAVIIADYNKGVLTDKVLTAIAKLQQKNRKFLAIDSKKLDRFSFLKPDLVKPNYAEITDLLTQRVLTGNRPKQVREMGKDLWKKTNAILAAVTLDEEGVCFFKEDSFLFHLPAQPIARPKVSGAGDTFISVCLLALKSGANLEAAANLALDAASIAIQKENTAVCGFQELLANYEMSNKVFEKNIAAICKMY